MSGVIEWLLGLERIRLDGPAPVSLHFATAPAPWIMLFGAVIAAVMVLRLYRRERVASRWRYSLMALRFGVIMTVLFMLSRPSLVLRRNELERSVAVILLDASSSMLVNDVAGQVASTATKPPGRDGVPGNGERSRWGASIAVMASRTRGLAQRLLRHHEVELWTFGESAQRIGRARNPDEWLKLGETLKSTVPQARGSDLSTSLAGVLEATRARRLSGVIVITDGRQTTGGSEEAALTEAQGRSVPIHGVCVGSERPRCDIELTAGWAEEDVFLHDNVLVQAQLSIRGLGDETPIVVELHDRATGELLARKGAPSPRGASTRRDELVYRPKIPGERRLVLKAVPVQNEENTENNSIEISINAHDDKLSVLYVEDSPRYEYRFLKNLLLREASVESSFLLLSASPGFTQEGTRPITRFPRSEEELHRYDVVILGDVDPGGDWLSPVQATLLTDFVSQRGGGIAFIAGERNLPRKLRRSRLERLAPVKIATVPDTEEGGDRVEPFKITLTSEGRSHSIFAGLANEADGGFARTLPGFYWFAPVDGPLPGATVLAVHPTARHAKAEVPIVVLGRFGRGRTMYLGSDDLWRWRENAGDLYYSRFWLQVIRTLARGRRWDRDEGWRIETDRRRYELGEAVRISLTAGGRTERALPAHPTLLVADAEGNPVERVAMQHDAAETDRAQGEFRPRNVGSYTIGAEEGSVLRGAAPRTLVVRQTDQEQARLESDPAFLKSITNACGGQCIRLGEDLNRIVKAMPDRSIRIPADIEEPIWDTRLMLGLFTVLIATEWIIRKAIGLN